MANNVQDRVLDLGLNVLDTEATAIYICSQEPTTYTEAITTYDLGFKSFGAGNVFGSPAAGSPGRKVTSAPVTDGSVTDTGTATHVAVVDVTNTRLLAVTSLSASQGVTNGNTFTLAAFDIKLLNS